MSTPITYPCPCCDRRVSGEDCNDPKRHRKGYPCRKSAEKAQEANR